AIREYHKEEEERDPPPGIVPIYEPDTEATDQLTIKVTLNDFRPEEDEPELSISGFIEVTVTGQSLSETTIRLASISTVGSITAQNLPGVQEASIDGTISWNTPFDVKVDEGPDSDGPPKPDSATGTITVDGEVYELAELGEE
ncbi:MAG: hypothetical protein EA427_01070, partial [Spirochaetaceae bacterium]